MRICRLLLGLMLLLAMHAAALAQNRVVAPLTGTVSAGTWVCNQRLTVGAMPNGFMAYSYMLPQGYNAAANIVYPLVIAEHWNDGGMNGSSYPDTSCPGGTFGGTMDTVNMRRGYPAIVVAPKADQSIDPSGSNGNSNFGGYADSPNSGGNEQGVNALVAYFKANFKVDATRVYCTGDSLGGIGCLAQMVDNNQINGVNSIFTAGLLFSDQLYRPATSPNPASLFNRMKTVPLMAVSTPFDNSPSSYDQPAWQNDTGNSNYPTKAQYDANGVSAMRAGTSNYYYQAVTDGTNPWDYYRALNADGGDGTNMYTWLFSQISGSTAATETVSVNPVGTPTANTAFIVSGTIANATGTPTLRYQDNAGGFVALPSGASVTSTTFTFTHPGMSAGSQTLTVQDSVTGISGTKTFTVGGTAGGTFTSSADVVNYLKGLPSGTFIFGQETYADLSDITAVQNIGVNPGLIACDLYRDGANTFGEEDCVPNLITYWNSKKGLVGLGASVANPINQTSATDTSGINAAQMITPGTSQYNAFIGEVDKMSGALKRMTDVGVIPLFRPLHEGVGNFFWWGTGNFSTAQFQTLWQIMHDRITVTNGLAGKVVFTYAANVGWPGDSYVDINGYDVYSDNPTTTSEYVNAYNAAVTNHPNTPFAATEYGTQNNPNTANAQAVFTAIHNTWPKVVYALVWNGYWTATNMANIQSALADSFVLKAPIVNTGVAVETLSVNTVPTRPQSTTFVVSGTITAVTTPPTLQYRDNSGNWVAFPSGSAVTASSFSFTHPALTAGSYTVSVRDAANTSISATSNTFVVSGVESSNNTVVTTVGPAITDASGNQWTLGASGTILENANGITGPPGSGGQIVTPTTGGSITDLSGHVWTLPGGNITEDGSAVAGGGGTSQIVYAGGVVYFQDASTLQWFTYDGSNFNSSAAPTVGAAITEIAYVNHVVWVMTSTGQWYSWSGTAWTGPSASPIGNTETLVITTIPTQAQNVGFTVAGTISGTSTAPSLQYQDDGGTWVNFPTGTTTPTGGIQATRAYDFQQSIGVNMQVQSYGSGAPYTNGSGMVTDLNYIGAKYLRDGTTAATAGAQLTAMTALANAGFKWTILPSNDNNNPFTFSIANTIAAAKKIDSLVTSGHAVIGLEMFNEPSNWMPTYLGVTSWAQTAKADVDYFTALGADGQMSSIPVWSVSESGAQTSNVGLQYLTIPTGGASTGLAGGTQLAEVYNIHIYPTFNNAVGFIDPSSLPLSTPSGNHDQFHEQWDQDFGPTTLHGFPGNAEALYQSAAKVITEFGLSTSSTPHVDARTKAVNMVNGYLNAYFVGNWQKAFAYELYEEGDGYGFFTTTGSATTTATYLHNLTSVIADTGGSAASFAPGSLGYTLSGLPATAQTALMQRSDGHFELVVWANTTNYNINTNAAISIGNTSITLALTQAANVKTYDVISGDVTAPTQTLTGVQSVTMNLSDHAIIFDINPTGGTGAVGTRLWYGQPGGNGSAWNTPFGNGATWSNATDADNIDACRGWNGSSYTSTNPCYGNINTNDNYGFSEYIGQSTDSTYKITVTNGRTQPPDNGSTATYTLHIPTGATSPGPYPGDNSVGIMDRAAGNTRIYGFGLSLPPPGLQPGQGPFGDGGLGEWDDASSDTMGHDADTGLSGFIVAIGAINYCDVNITCNPAYPHILHAQRYSTDLHLLKSNAPNINTGVLSPDSWPQRLQDSQNPPSGPYSGNLKAGSTLGIPITATAPAGLNTNCKAQFWNWQHYPLFFRDQAGGGFNLTVDQVASTSAFVNDLRGCLPQLVSYLRVLRNQHQTGQSFTTNPINGPGARVDTGPPPLVGQTGSGTGTGGTTVGGSTITTTAFSFPHPGMAAGAAHVIKVRDANATSVVATSNSFIVTGGTVPQTETLALNAVGTQTAGVAFLVSGSIANAATVPTLQYQVNGGTWLAMPSGSSVTVNSFSFTVASLNASSANTIAVRDGNIQTVTATSNSFAVTAAPAESIAIASIGTQRVGSTFTVTGTVTNPANALVLQYQNNGGAWQALPGGFSLVNGVFSFTNPAPTASNAAATVGIRDASNNAIIATSNAFQILLATSANNSVVTQVGPQIVDASGEVFTITSSGQVAVNGVVDSTTSNVVALAYVSGTVWYENSGFLWRGKTVAANAWTPTAGTLTSPLPAESLAVNTIASHTQNTAFQVTGTISAALLTPSLQYQVSGGLWVALPSGSAVTPTSFSFTVPGIQTLGAASISVRDAGNNAISAFSNTFQITAVAVETIAIQPVGNQPIGAPFSVSGTIAGALVAPTLQYADGSGAFQALPAGASVTSSGFSFVHPPLPAATAQTVTVRDAARPTIAATSPAFVVVAQESANRATVTDVGPKLVDAFGSSYQLTAGGQVSVNGVVDPTTANVIELVYVNRQVWYENSNLHWFARQASGSWTPVGGTLLGPVPSSKPVLYHTNSAPLAVVPNFTIPIPGLVLNDTVVSGQFSLDITSVCGVISMPGATGNGTTHISIKGALATVNAALSGLKFTGKTVGTGSVTLTATDPANVVATLAIVVKVPRSAAVLQ